MQGYKKLSAFQLKIIAIIAMIVDHVGLTFIDEEIPYNFARGVGRLAFPIFAFLIVEGFRHTKNIKSYILRMALFAIISEVPFDLLLSGKFFNFEKQSAMLELLIGLVAITLIDFVESTDKVPTKLLRFVANPGSFWIRSIIEVAILLLFMVLSWVLKADYLYAGIFLIVMFYVSNRDDRGIVISILLFAFAFYGKSIQWASVLSIVPIIMYNGERGRNLKYFFYIFYPLHMLVIYGIYLLIK